MLTDIVTIRADVFSVAISSSAPSCSAAPEVPDRHCKLQAERTPKTHGEQTEARAFAQ
jgi:hypothetical protein